MKNNYKIILGVAGRKGHGKDAAVERLVKDHGFVVIKMATPLKSMLRAYLDYVMPQIPGGYDKNETIDKMVDGSFKELPSGSLLGKTPRYAMQTIGTEWGRKLIGDNIWIDAFQSACAPYDRIVCTDVRFPNEVDKVREMGGRIVLIERTAKMPKKRSLWSRFLLWIGLRKPLPEEHPSEAQISDLDVDGVIFNDTTIEDLQAKTVRAALDPNWIEH